MKKKFITLLLCAAVGIGALSGCGGNTPAKELPEDSVAADIEEVLNIKLFKYRKKFFVYGTVFFIMWQLVTASAEK